MEATAIENQNKLCVDAFQFSYFPLIWPSEIQREGTVSVSEVELSVNQIFELREYYRHQLSLPRAQRIHMSFCLTYFSLHSTYIKNNCVLRNLALRKVPGEYGGGDIVRDQIRQYLQTPATQQKITEQLVPENRQESPEQFVPENRQESLEETQENSDPTNPNEEHDTEMPESQAEPCLILMEDGGPQLVLQLERGDPYALNPAARGKPFQRNRGYANPLGDQDFSKNIVVPPNMLSSYGLPTFGGFPTLVDRGGDRTWLEGIDTEGNPLHLHMDTHPHNMILIDMTTFTNEFLREEFEWRPDQRAIFDAIRDRLASETSFPADPVEKRDPRVLFWMFRNLLKKVGVFNNLFSSVKTRGAPEYDTRRSQSTGTALAKAWLLYQEEQRSSTLEKQGTASSEMRELELSYCLYFKYYDARAIAVGKMNWETPDIDLEMIPQAIRRQRQAALISHTVELQPLSSEQQSSYPVLQGGGRIPSDVQATLREVKLDEKFVGQATRKRPPSAQKNGKGAQAKRQMSHGDGRLGGQITWLNIGVEPTALGAHMNSGRANRITMEEGKRKRLFDKHMETIECYGKKRKLIEVMRGSKAENIATAWTLHCDTKIRRAGASQMWVPRLLMIPELTMAVTSLQKFHFGAEFPVVLTNPDSDEVLQIPDNLWRVCLHDYHGPNSAHQESTVEIRSDPILCAD